MKKLVIASLAIACAASVYAQGTIQFANYNTATAYNLNARIYGQDPSNPNRIQTGATNTTSYAGPLLAGSNYRAQLFAVSGLNALESELVAATPVTTFRTGAAAGVFATVTATMNNVAGTGFNPGNLTLQVRAWDNSSGLYATWAAFEAANVWGSVAAGKSAVFNFTGAVGGGLVTPTYYNGLQSFNIYTVPEPSTFALAGLGAAAMLIFRRRK